MADASITYVSSSYNKDATRHNFNGGFAGRQKGETGRWSSFVTGHWFTDSNLLNLGTFYFGNKPPPLLLTGTPTNKYLVQLINGTIPYRTFLN